MTRKKKALAVFNYVRSSEYEWRDPLTKTRLAAGAIQNWPSADLEKWILKERKVVKRLAIGEGGTRTPTAHMDVRDLSM